MEIEPETIRRPKTKKPVIRDAATVVPQIEPEFVAKPKRTRKPRKTFCGLGKSQLLVLECLRFTRSGKGLSRKEIEAAVPSKLNWTYILGTVDGSTEGIEDLGLVRSFKHEIGRPFTYHITAKGLKILKELDKERLRRVNQASENKFSYFKDYL